MMRKTFVIILLTAFCITGCTFAPEKVQIAMQKDMEQMLVKATTQDTDAFQQKSLSEYIAAPKKLQAQLQNQDGKLKVEVAAAVIIPDTDSMPIYKVKSTNFSQDQVSVFCNVLCGDAVMMEMQDILTRQQVQDLITYRKRLMKEEGKENDQQTLKIISSLEEQLKTAPDRIEPIVSDRLLKKKYINDDEQNRIGSYTELCIYEGDSTSNSIGISVRNNNDLKEAYLIEQMDESGRLASKTGISVRRRARMDYSDNRNSASGRNYSSSALFMDMYSDENTNVGISPKAACAQAQELLGKISPGMAVDSVYLLNDEQKGNYDGEVRPAQKYVYKVICARKVGSVACSALDSMSKSVPSDSFAPTWNYEYMEIMVSGEGIYEVSWVAPLEIGEMVSRETKLIPFEQIEEIFKKMILIEYNLGLDFINERNIKIERVVLSLHRIVEQNSVDNGLLIPVWNFYGTMFELDENDEIINERYGESFLSINAIDGSIIDVQKGY